MLLKELELSIEELIKVRGGDDNPPPPPKPPKGEDD
jgi:hypothetical protein